MASAPSPARAAAPPAVKARPRARRKRWARGVSALGAIAVHVILLIAVLTFRSAPQPFDAAPLSLALVASKPPPAPEIISTAAQPAPSPAQAPSRPRTRREPTSTPEVLTAGRSDPGVSDAEFGQAAAVGSGSPGSACDMGRRVQAALRKDALVQAAVAGAQRALGPDAKAVRVWNGDWVQGSGEDGKGLAAVREAIMWEIAFAPEACRSEPMRGLVLLSLNEAPGSLRLAVGADRWRWSNLTRSGGGEP